MDDGVDHRAALRKQGVRAEVTQAGRWTVLDAEEFTLCKTLCALIENRYD